MTLIEMFWNCCFTAAFWAVLLFTLALLGLAVRGVRHVARRRRDHFTDAIAFDVQRRLFQHLWAELPELVDRVKHLAHQDRPRRRRGPTVAAE